jgi:5-methylcytosine-specific restriction endonuclease McrA
MEGLEMESTLLLAATYEPIDIISWKDAVRLMFLGKAEVVEEYEKELRSTYLIIKMPAVVRLLNVFKKRKKKVKFSRVNIYARDKYRCQYCGAKGKMKDFTFDHVVPRAQGGKTVWENIVTCCQGCNLKKGDKSLKQAGMHLIKKPVQPEWLPAVTIRISQKHLPEAWRDYLYWSGILEQD